MLLKLKITPCGQKQVFVFVLPYTLVLLWLGFESFCAASKLFLFFHILLCCYGRLAQTSWIFKHPE